MLTERPVVTIFFDSESKAHSKINFAKVDTNLVNLDNVVIWIVCPRVLETFKALFFNEMEINL